MERPKDLLTADEMKAWRYPKLLPLALDLALIWLQVAGAVYLFRAFPNPLVYFVCLLLIGGAQHGMGLVAHEGTHFLVFPKNRRLNDLVVGWLYAAPIALPFTVYRTRHWAHHRLVCTEDDTKNLYRRNFTGWRMIWEVVRSLLGLDFMSQVFNVSGGVAKADQKTQLRRDLVQVLVAQSVLLVALGPLGVVLLWWIPLATSAQLFSKFRSAAEHRPLDSEQGDHHTDYYRDTEYPLLRSLQANWWECLFLSRLNFHYHAEHHLWPQISYQYLPILSRRLQESGGHPGVTFEGSYSSVFWKFFRGL